MEFKSAQCPTCGGSLQLPHDRRTVNCMYCGATVVVQEAIQAAAAATVPNLLKLARAAAQSSNHVEAYDYFTRVLELDAANSSAWAGKAEAAGRLSGQHSFRMPEMVTYFRHAVEFATDDETRELIGHAAANTICKIVTDDFLRMRQALSPKFWDSANWNFYLNRVGQLITVLTDADRFIPNNIAILQTLVWFCDHNMDRTSYQSVPNGKVAKRALDESWNVWVRELKAHYLERLYSLKPELRSVVRTDRTKSQTTNWIPGILIVTGFCVVGVVLLVLGIALNDSGVSNNSGHNASADNRKDDGNKQTAVTNTLKKREALSQTAEYTPRLRVSRDEEFDGSKLKNLIDPKKGGKLKVRVTGLLFYDSEHALGPFKLLRRTDWEIHPVFRLEFCPKDKTCLAGSDENWVDINK